MIYKMKKYLFSLIVMLTGSVLLTGCLKSDDNNTPTEYVVTKGALIINNGNARSGIDGSLTFIDLSANPISAQQNVFRNVNGRSLGGTPNDVMVYGDKIYIAGTDENTVFVCDRKTFSLIKPISTTSDMGEAEGVSPRHFTAYGSKVYVSTYGGYVGVIDTPNLTIGDMYKVGSAPEGMTIGGTSETDLSLYVCNSDYGNGNGSISKISLSNGSVTEIKNASIHNPQEIAVAGEILYVLDWGYYDENLNQKEAGVYRIYGSNVAKVVPDATGMAAANQSIVTYNYPYGSSKPTFSLYNVAYDSLTSFTLSGGDPIESPCAIGVDPNTGMVYIASRVIDETGHPSYKENGFVNIYNGSGQFVGSSALATGVEPHAIAFTYGTAKIQY
jgi:hypothetical protein